jgi:Na+-driven multidrug efflux pump
MIVYMAFGMLVGSGGAVRISINLGKKDYKRAERVLGNSVTLAVGLGVIVVAIGFLIKNQVLVFSGREKRHSDTPMITLISSFWGLRSGCWAIP